MADFYPGCAPAGDFIAPDGYPAFAPSVEPAVSDVEVPYTKTLENGLLPGMVIHVHGHIPDDGDRFFVNLSVGASEEPRADIALHINPRLEAGKTVLNTLINGRWGSEQREDSTPFQPGQHFEMIICAEEEQYKIAVNGEHYVEYQHKIPIAAVDTITIRGNVHISYLRVDQPGQVPSYAVAPVASPDVPCFLEIPGGMAPGKYVIVNGKAPDGAKRFIVNVQQGATDKPENIALHFNPRFSNQTVVMNAKQNNHYGQEIHSETFPFVEDQTFQMMIFCDSDEFKVSVDGEHFIEFPHRLTDDALSECDTIAIFCDLQVDLQRLI